MNAQLGYLEKNCFHWLRLKITAHRLLTPGELA